MLAGIASLVFIPLLSVSLVHLLWAFGMTYPVKSEQELARTVVGAKDIEKMPPRWASFLVSVLVFVAGIWALALSDTTPDFILILGGLATTLIFLLRGIVGYLPKWRARMCEEPFATLDRKIYSPLCLYLAAGFGLLTFLNATPIAG